MTIRTSLGAAWLLATVVLAACGSDDRVPTIAGAAAPTKSIACGNQSCAVACCDKGCVNSESDCVGNVEYLCDGPEDCADGEACCYDTLFHGNVFAGCTTRAGCEAQGFSTMCHGLSDCPTLNACEQTGEGGSGSFCVPLCSVMSPTDTSWPRSCTATQTCVPSSTPGGASTCVTAGPGAAGASCTSGSDCLAGLVCSNGGCTRLCASDADCPGGALGSCWAPPTGIFWAGSVSYGWCE